jgi:hypothetical protein
MKLDGSEPTAVYGSQFTIRMAAAFDSNSSLLYFANRFVRIFVFNPFLAASRIFP